MYYSPVRHSSPICEAFDLHVLGTPPAFILSQDQTLHCPSISSDNFGLFSSFLFLKLKLTLCFILSCSVFNVLSLVSLVECPFILPSISPFCKAFSLSFFIFFLCSPSFSASVSLFFIPLYFTFVYALSKILMLLQQKKAFLSVLLIETI